MADNVIDVLLRARMEASGVEAGVGQIQKTLKGLTLPKGITDDLEKSFGKLTPLLKDYQKQLNKGFSNQRDLKNFNLLKEKIDDVFGDIKTKIGEVNGQEVRLKTDVQAITKLEKELDNLQNKLSNKMGDVFKKGQTETGIKDGIKELQNALNITFNSGALKMPALSKLGPEIAKAFNSKDFASFNNQLQELQNRIANLSTGRRFDIAQSLGFKGAADDIKGIDKTISDFISRLQVNKTSANAIESIRQQIKQLGTEIEQTKLDSLNNALNALDGASGGIDQLQAALQGVQESSAGAAAGMISMQEQVSQLQQSTQYFFSLRNMINLLKRGVSEAIDTVKELDAAMTETAVVTDFSVGDMWEKLPEYTANANALGASVKDMYEATTLYYQQGLNSEQSMSIAAETMKMARIGGLEAADATDKMTAALRGFNMELNEASAKRVNDVYSNLAAKTASDTEELGTAMQRTASIAASAGMSFEGTAAFLAQAIETTREPAENLGTAMKTIVARFTELKKNPLEISEVDGEEVDYNKVDTALKSIGVSLKDDNGQFRELDQVFLDIAQRWDSLSQTQQRYIATTAAGSRQQSRFIAMMSNYDRTVQLMDYANNSAGASNEQFGKTMESLEAKLNKLKNAWDQFEMGIAGNTIIKGAVDGLTGFLNITNKIINALSLGSNTIKSFLSIFAAFTGLKVMGRVANRAIGGLGGLIDPNSSVREGLKGGFLRRGQSEIQAKAISQPIVNSLEKISSQISGIIADQKVKNNNQNNNDTANKITSKEEYAKARKNYDQLNRSEGFKIKEASQIFGGLDAQHQLSLFNNNPGTKTAMQKASLQWFNSKGLSKELTNEGKGYIRSIYKGMEQGQIPVDKGIKLIGRPDLWGEHFGTETAQNISKAITQQYTQDSQLQKAAEAGAWRQLNLKGASQQYKEKFLSEAKNMQSFNNLVSQNLSKAIGGKIESETGNIKGQVSTFGTFTNTVGGLADKFTQAGYAITSFGSALSQIGGPVGAIGSALQSLGGIVTSFGMGLSSVMNIIPAFTAGITTASGEVVVAASTVASAFAIVGAAIAGIMIAKKQLKDINDAAQQVTDTYKESSQTAQQNISDLKAYRAEYARLSKGVDSNGNNINLDTSDYDRYLEITNKLAEINPDLVEGYNAQGQAIISNNNALEETLYLEQKRQKQLVDQYTSEESLQKLLEARNYTAGFGQAAALKDKQSQAKLQKMYGNVAVGMEREAGQSLIIPMQTTVQDTAKQLKKAGYDEAALKKYGIESFDALIEGQEQAVNKFVKYQDKIRSEVNASGIEMGKALTKSFDKLGEKTDAFNEAIQPVYENLLTNISNSSAYKSVAPEFRSALTAGLKDLAGQDLNASEMIKQANAMALKFTNLSSSNSKYTQALKTAEEAQNKFANTLSETQYKTDVQPAIDELTRLKQAAVDEGGAYGDALAEYLENQIRKISDFTKDGAANLQQALNTMTDQIAAAEGALESFNAIAEGSTYGKAAKNMSQIFETATADEHMLGEGDQAFWAGAEALVGRKSLLESGRATKEDALEMMQAVQQMIQGGQEGWDAFKTKWFDTADANFKTLEDGSRRLLDENGKVIEGLKLDDDNWIGEIDEKINPEVYDQIADALDMSKESLIAMLNLGRQFGEVDFTNIQDVRKALATSENTIKNAENGKVFAKKESFEAEMTQAGIDLNKQQEIERELQDKYNTEFIQSVEQIAKDNSQLTRMGIKDMDSLIKTFDATGQYTKDEIAKYAEAYQKSQGKEFNEAKFEEKWNANQQDTEFGGIPSSLASIESILSSIESILASQRLEEGHLDNPIADETKQMMFGEAGKKDTEFQAFQEGKNTQGNYLTKADYEATNKNLSDFITQSAAYVNELKQAKKVAKSNGDTAEVQKIQDEINAFTGKNGFISKAKEWQKEGQQAYQEYETQTQEKINAINQGFNNLLSGITPDSVNTEAAQQTLAQLYEAAISGTAMAVNNSATLDQLSSLGLNIEQAMQTGLINVGDGVYEAWANKSNQLESDMTEGAKSSAESADTSGAEQSVGQAVKSGVENIYQSAANAAQTVALPSVSPTIQHDQEQGEKRTAQLKPTVDTSELDKAEDKTNTVVNTLNQGADFVINVAGDEQLQQAAKDAQNLSKNAGAKTVGVKTSFDSSAAVAGVASINAMSAKIKVGADTSSAMSTVNSAVSAINSKKATIKVSTSVSGQNVDIYVTKHIKTTTSKGPSTGGYITNGGVLYRARGGVAEHPGYPKKGTDIIPAYLTPGEYVENREAVDYFGVDFMRRINHKDLIGALQVFGSAAKGRYGRLGPNGKGGLTLTGEQGFEVAWIPSENRSMILGANGPQMADLPSDTIVWDHKQSKKIISQNAIPAGSHYVRGKGAVRPTSGGTSSSSGSSSKSSSSGSSSTEKAAEELSDASKLIVNVSVWWENIARLTEATQRRADKNQKTYEKYLKDIRSTLKTTGTIGQANDYIANLTKVIGLNEQQISRATLELTNMTYGTAAQQAAWKTADDSDNISAREKAYTAGKGGAIQISYKNGKDSVDELVNTFSYIKEQDGTYVIDQAKLDQIENKEKRKAVADELNKELNDRISKRNKAEDEIQKAREALDKLGEELYETFFAWEIELTKIWNLTQKIETNEKNISRFKSYGELLNQELSSGIKEATVEFANVINSVFQNQINKQINTIKKHEQLIKTNQEEIDKLLNTNDEISKLNAINQNLATTSIYESAQAAANALTNARNSKTAADNAVVQKQIALAKARTAQEKKKAQADLKTAKLNQAAANSAIGGAEAQYNAAIANYNNVKNSGRVLDPTERMAYQKQAEELQKQIAAIQMAQNFLTVSKYADGTLEVDFNTDAFEQAQQQGNITSDMAKQIQDYVKKLTEASSDLNEAYNTLTEDLSNLYQSLADLKDKWSDYSEQLLNSLEKEQQKDIDRFKKLSDAITNSLKKLYDEVKRKLTERRQQEDNRKTEQDINKKQQRLAALQADTAGGNQVEIAQLQKEIADAQQNYQRSLEDQMLDKLQEQADKAAEQRERQIELMEAQLEATNNAALVNLWMSDPASFRNEIYDAYMTANDYANQPLAKQEELERRFNELYNGLLTNRDQQETVQKAIVATQGQLTTIQNSINEMVKISGTAVKGSGTVSAAGSSPSAPQAAPAQPSPDLWNTLRNVTQNMSVTASSGPALGSAVTAVAKAHYGNKALGISTNWDASIDSHGRVVWHDTTGNIRYYDPATGKVTIDRYNEAAFRQHAGAYKPNAKQDVWYGGKQGNYGNQFYPTTWQEYYEALQSKNSKRYPKRYATGGIADYTGPAWLDGTPGKPELVLNATDTKNFLVLRDVLSRVMGSINNTKDISYGDTSYQININVDHINNDYDVDKITERVKRNIVKEASYRNVTQVRNFR